MIRIPTNPNYRANARQRRGESPPCVVCGRAIASARTRYMHVWNGVTAVLESETASLDPAGDTGHLPIGSDCLRSHPELRAYVV